mgnify:CR=1 FL=1
MFRRSQQLKSDERGMILVVALPMAALLIGCLWYVISVGDAALHRERLQDVADATAWQSAVLHARALNAEVSLNLISASLWSVPAALQALQVVGASAAALTPEGRPLLELALASDRELSPRVSEIVRIVHDTQLALRATAPLVAAAEASRNNTVLARELDAADGAIALSYAALPLAEQAALTADARKPWLLTAAATQTVALTATSQTPARNHSLSDASLPLVPTALHALEIDPRAHNGNALLQTWSIAKREHFRKEQSDERGMNLAFPTAPIDIQPKNAAFAQAEYYFDCTDTWERCAANAAWNPRWTARLRRFARPDGEGDPMRARRVGQAFLRASTGLERSLQRAGARDARAYVQALFDAPACGHATCLH